MARTITRSRSSKTATKVQKPAPTTKRAVAAPAPAAKRRSVTVASRTASAPKKPGRPLGSKNIRRPAAASKAAVAPKMSKAELEAQVKKLEAALARARKQIIVLKAEARNATADAAAIGREAAAQTEPAEATERPAAAKRGRKPKADTLAPGVVEDSPAEASSRLGRGRKKSTRATTEIASASDDETGPEADASEG